MLWALLIAMSLIAIAFAVWPLVRDLPRQTVLTMISIVFVSGTAATFYYFIGEPDIPSGASVAPDGSNVPDISQMVTSLAERLRDEPDDLNGWIMLGRSYMTLGNFTAAAEAYQRAVALESAQNAQTLVALGVALIEGNGRQITAEAISVFENALTLEPNNPEALFWGGIGAFNNGNSELAATRWETLLATNPPPEVQRILTERIAVWRGEPVPAIAEPSSDGNVVMVNVSLGADARAALPAEATLFVIARDPQQPSPPIAVSRRALSELPAQVPLGDRESMIPGRKLSGFAEFELIARVSVSGSPAAQPGDWFVSEIVRPAEAGEIDLAINERVE